MSVKILRGNCMDELAKLADRSVHCCVTSPPYWGLRDYKIPPTIWGEGNGCVHEFADETIATEVGRGNWAQGENGKGWQRPGGARAAKETMIYGEQTRGFCLHCGAWRGVLGLEPNHELYVDHMVAVFREVRRVLRDDGTLWLNLGDSYCSAPAGNHGNGTSTLSAAGRYQEHAPRPHQSFRRDREPVGGERHRRAGALKPKDLVGVPWRVAFALQDDGWWLRQDIIWQKPNPMPESVRDRCTKAHEYIFLLAKSEVYYCDMEAIAEPVADDTVARSQRGSRYDDAETRAGVPYQCARPVIRNPQPAGWDTGDGGHGSIHRDGRRKALEPGQAKLGAYRDSKRSGNKERKPPSERGAPADGAGAVAGSIPWEGVTRTKRSVWSVATKPFGEAHFATFPPTLIEPPILAGTSEAGCCPLCGAPWQRHVAKTFIPQDDVGAEKGVRGAGEQKPMDESSNWQGQPRGNTQTATRGWHPSCKCQGAWLSQVVEDPATGPGATTTVRWWAATGPVSMPIPCTVLDPFGGAGTTGLVADRLHRDAVLIELNPEYADMATRRIRNDSPLFSEVFYE